MKDRFLSIKIKDSTIEQVDDWLLTFSLNKGLSKNISVWGINIYALDLTEEYEAMSNFLKENGLKDETPFFNDFNATSFGISLEFDLSDSFLHIDLLEPVVFLLGQKISSILKTECLVMFENNSIPAGLFKNGELSKDFEKYNLSFFSNKAWRPS